jgi:hypothetical protein
MHKTNQQQSKIPSLCWKKTHHVHMAESEKMCCQKGADAIDYVEFDISHLQANILFPSWITI